MLCEDSSFGALNDLNSTDSKLVQLRNADWPIYSKESGRTTDLRYVFSLPANNSILTVPSLTTSCSALHIGA